MNMHEVMGSTSPQKLSLLACTLGALGFSLAHAAAVPTSDAPPQVPALSQPDIACSGAQAPSQRAQSLIETAHSRLERYAYDPSEGIAALRSLSEAARCQQQAGPDGERTVAQAELDALQHRIEADCRTRQLRLTRALAADRRDEAKSESRWLLRLFANRDDAYTRWLRHIERGAS